MKSLKDINLEETIDPEQVFEICDTICSEIDTLVQELIDLEFPRKDYQTRIAYGKMLYISAFEIKGAWLQTKIGIEDGKRYKVFLPQDMRDRIKVVLKAIKEVDEYVEPYRRSDG